MPKLHKVLICGEREYRAGYTQIVKREIRRRVTAHGRDNLLVIEGGAPGVDTLAKLAAKKQGVHVAEVEALWDIFHKGAGPKRNKVMAALEPHEVLAIHFTIEQSVGTALMLDIAESLGIPNRLLSA